jgi:hypothetical protein
LIFSIYESYRGPNTLARRWPRILLQRTFCYYLTVVCFHLARTLSRAAINTHDPRLDSSYRSLFVLTVIVCTVYKYDRSHAYTYGPRPIRFGPSDADEAGACNMRRINQILKVRSQNHTIPVIPVNDRRPRGTRACLAAALSATAPTRIGCDVCGVTCLLCSFFHLLGCTYRVRTSNRSTVCIQL